MNMKTASNRQLTLLRKLKRKKYRYKERLVFVEGIRAVRQVAANNVIEIDTLFFDEHQGYAAESYWEKLIAENQAHWLGIRIFQELLIPLIHRGCSPFAGCRRNRKLMK